MLSTLWSGKKKATVAEKESREYKKSKELEEVSGYIQSLKELTKQLSEKDDQIVSIQEDYKKIFNMFHDSVVVIDYEGYVIDYNKKAQKLLESVSGGKVIGEQWKKVIEGLGCNWENTIEKEVIENESRKELFKEVHIPDLKRDFLISVSSFEKESNTNYFIFTARDITRLKEREKDLIKKHNLITYIDQISDVFSNNLNINYILEKIVEILGKIEKVDMVYIYKNDVDTQGCDYAEIMKTWAAYDCSSRTRSLETFYYYNFPRWKEYFEMNNIICGSIGDFPRNERQFLGDEGIQSVCVVPIFTPAGWWGFLGFDSYLENKKWTYDEEKILKIAANIIGGGIYQWTLRNINNTEVLKQNCINF